VQVKLALVKLVELQVLELVEPLLVLDKLEVHPVVLEVPLVELDKEPFLLFNNSSTLSLVWKNGN